MNDKASKKLNKFRNYSLIKVEYGCADCGYIVYRTLYKDDIALLLKDKENFEPIQCGVCGEEKMTINGIMSERDFYKKNPDFMIGD